MVSHFIGGVEMNRKPWLINLFLLSMLLVFANSLFANSAKFVNAVTAKGQCGHEKIGKLDYLQNSDQNNSYSVTVRTTAMRAGKARESDATHSIKPGGKIHLGCTMSEIMPLTSYTRVIVAESKGQ